MGQEGSAGNFRALESCEAIGGNRDLQLEKLAVCCIDRDL